MKARNQTQFSQPVFCTQQRQTSQPVMHTFNVINGCRLPIVQCRNQHNPEVNYSGSKWTVFGSPSFGSGKHSWSVCISGNFTAGFAFGVEGIPQDQHCCGLQWTWSSGNKYQPLSQSWKCAISNCMNNDVIEFYLDYDNQTLMMYNQRTRQLDTWRGIQGEVHRTFQLCCSGDVASLPCQVTSSKENLRDGTIDECDYGTDQNVNPEVW